ncbi:MAG TPA: cytochrome c [Longilinea sp.]|nr:cytochrome c [Longilinea sp.]
MTKGSTVLKRLIILLVILLIPLGVGLLFTYDVIKIEWISTMKIQPVAKPQRDPLPMPDRSIPIQGASYIAGLGAPVNPVPADSVSLTRGQQLFNTYCSLCHGTKGDGKGPFWTFLAKHPPANLLSADIKNGSDGTIFITITNGVSGAMPAMRENLPAARDRWDVVNYVRKLEQASP